MLRPPCASFAAFLILALSASWCAAAESSPPAPTKSSSAPRPAAGRGNATKGPLPDPLLLDGSTHAAEKRPEHGMIGDFELPGDENVRNGKVGGGPQNAQGGERNAGNLPMGLPQGAGGAQSSQGLPGGLQGPQGAQAGGAEAGGPPPSGAQAGGQNTGGPSDPNAKAEGMQVAGLSGEGGRADAAVKGSKPQNVAIGDSAMRIEGSPNSPDVVGAQTPAGPTQQHEKGTGSGGKGSSGSGTNKGVERGRAMPSGL